MIEVEGRVKAHDGLAVWGLVAISTVTVVKAFDPEGLTIGPSSPTSWGGVTPIYSPG